MILTILAGVCCSITYLIFILGIMSSSGLCVSCKEPLTSPNVKFCSQCGASQTRPQLCIHCKAQLPSNSPYCSNCGKPQSHSKQQEPSVKWCGYCKTQLPPDAIYCIKCSKPPLASSQEPAKSTSCILCKCSLKGTPQNCNFCTAPQDSNELIKRSFKECHKCGKNIFSELKVCIYQNCLALQETPPSTPAPEGMQSFTPQAPPNLEHFHESQGIQSPDPSHPSQFPRDFPDTSLQPTDKPLFTKEEMEKKFKSTLPPVTSIDTTSVATGSTQNSPMNVTGITSAVADPKKDGHVSPMETDPDVSTGRVSGHHKRSSGDEEESGDVSKRVKTNGGAAVASGAVLLEKVDDTYTITGETTATSSNASFLPSLGTNSTGDNTSLQTAARKRKQSDLDESKDSLVPPHPKKPETADKTHDKDNMQEMERHETKNDQKKEFEKEQHDKTTLDDSRGGDKEVASQGKEKGENAAAPGHNRKDGGRGDSEDRKLKESKEGLSSDRNDGQSFVAEASDSDSAPSPGTPLKPHPPAPSSDSQATSSSEVASSGLPLGQGNNSGDSPPSSTTDPLLNINPAGDKPPHPIQETNSGTSNTDPKLAHPIQETNGGPSNTDPKPTHPVQEINSTQQANDKPSNGKPSQQLTVQHDGSQSPSDKGKKGVGEKKGDQQSVTGNKKKQDKDKNDKKEVKPALPVPNP